MMIDTSQLKVCGMDGCTAQPWWLVPSEMPSSFMLEPDIDYVSEDDESISSRFITWQILRILTYRDE